MKYKRQRAKIQLKLIMRNTMPGLVWFGVGFFCLVLFSGREQQTQVCNKTQLLVLTKFKV